MSFFSFAFLENAMSFQGYLKYIAIFVSLGALFVVTSLYLRHRLQTKYRDLSIIFLLLIIFLLGVQYNQYERSEVYAADTLSRGDIFKFGERQSKFTERRYSYQ